jgi:hypothetical protein
MDMEELKPILAGLVRHGLTSAGGYLVASGVIQSSQVSDLVGAGMVLAGIAWSWWQKKGQSDINAAFKVLTANVKPASTSNTVGASK